MHTVQGTLNPTAPFDFDKSLEFLGQFRPAMGEQRTDEGILTKAVSINGTVVVFRIQSTGTLDAPELAYILYSDEPLDETLHQAVRDRIGFFLSLEDDLRPFYAIGEADPAFEPVIQELYGYHQVKFLTPFEKADMPNSGLFLFQADDFSANSLFTSLSSITYWDVIVRC